MQDININHAVREGYARVARQSNCGCSPHDSCCGNTNLVRDMSKTMGYSDEELASVPEGSNLGLGCGNPLAFTILKKGDTVLDLGSGAGFDCFLAANIVGQNGKIIGVDMTPEMIEKSRINAREENYTNVEFRLGEIENLPVADNYIDVIISNCVVNLCPDKKRVFREAFRVLKPGGMLMVSDIVLLKELPDSIRNSVEAYISCIAGAMMKDEYIDAIAEAGFTQIRIIDETIYPVDCMVSDPNVKAIIDQAGTSMKITRDVADSVVSIKVQGIRPE